MRTIRDVYNEVFKLPEDKIKRPIHFLCGPGVYSQLAGATDGVKLEVMPTKESAMGRFNELTEENKTVCILTHEATVYCPQENGNVIVLLVYIDGNEIKWRPIGEDGK